MKRVSVNTTILDHLLMGIASALSVYSCLVSVNSPARNIFTIGTLISSMLGFAISRALPEKWSRTLSAPLYAIMGISMFVFARPMNALFPEPGFPIQIIVAGIFTWMILFGGLLAWGDNVLCFLAIPCIALFGLVGAFDIFQGAPAAFFVFLVCSLSVFYRSHARRMARYAFAALNPGQDWSQVDEGIGARLRDSGAWRWIAGPEWALGSALVIVFLSVFGAPVIRTTVEPITQNFRSAFPSVVRAAVTGQQPSNADSYRVGRGPTSSFNIPALKVRTEPGQWYLRQQTYETFTGTGWQNNIITTGAGGGQPLDLPIWAPDEIRPTPRRFDPNLATPSGTDFEFAIKDIQGGHQWAMIPGEPLELSGLEKWRLMRDGTVRDPGQNAVSKYSGRARKANTPTKEISTVPPGYGSVGENYLLVRGFSNRFSQLVESIVSDSTTDYERATKIKEYIASNIQYNLKAPAMPDGVNVVEELLFGDVKQGYCDLFATTMTTMARKAGLASRIGAGALVRNLNADADGYYQITDADFHMWSEVYFEGVGWVVFDATENAENVTPPDGTIAGGAPRILAYVLIGAFSLGGLGLLISATKFRWKRNEAILKKRHPAARSISTLLHALERESRLPRRFNETLGEYASRVRPDDAGLRDLVRWIDASLYGGKEEVPEAEYKTRIKEYLSVSRKP
jgi:transglutaminase-like putative cysteine protease